MRKLTIKQATFLNHILEGKNQLESYKLVYKSKSIDSTLRVKASKLFNSPSIQEAYLAALKELQSNVLYSRENAIKDLIFLIDESKADISEKGIKQANVLGLTKAIEQINNIAGLSLIENTKLEMEKERLELSKSKINSENQDLQKENASLLRELVTGNNLG